MNCQELTLRYAQLDDDLITVAWMDRHGVGLLRVSLSESQVPHSALAGASSSS
jgi:hypothetical protein